MSALERVSNRYLVRERSDYQLEHFVVGQHDTPQMQYRQILIEAKALVYKIRITELEVQKQRIKQSRLTDDPLDRIKFEKYEIGIAATEDVLEAAKEELACLARLAQRYPHYSPKDIEENQQEYWEARLQRQAHLDRLSSEQQVSVGNLESMLNSGLLYRELQS